MSVLTVDTEVINYIRVGIERASYGTTLDSNFINCMVNHNRTRDIEKECLRLVRAWTKLNDMSYAGRYRETFVDNTEEITQEPPFKEITPVQLLKYVQCLNYNIEPEYFEMTEQEQEDYKLLKQIEHDIMTAIIGATKEYKSAE